MSILRKSVLLGAAIAVASFQFALAADAPIVEIDYGPAPYQYKSNWYLRGDIGYVVAQEPEVTYFDGVVSFQNEDLGTTWMIGGGLGYRHGSWFRSDLTFDFRQFDFTGNTPCPGCGQSNEKYDLETWTIMLNAYAELGTWYGVSPYVGVGAGMAYHWLNDIVGVNPDGSITIIPDGGKWSFAAAGMAGLSIATSDSAFVDVGYRYIWLGDAESGADAIGGTVVFNDIATHEFRFGIRHEL